MPSPENSNMSPGQKTKSTRTGSDDVDMLEAGEAVMDSTSDWIRGELNLGQSESNADCVFGEDSAGLALGEVALTFKDVAFSIPRKGGDKERQSILEPVSGHFEPGTLAAIMGPSGSGKTTLMDILAAKKTSQHDGVVHLNGRPRDGMFKRICAYVPQHDVMPAYLTVREAVLFQFALKEEWPKGFTREMARKLTDKRLQTLGLYEVRDSRIGDEHIRGISGGQKRRLSLAKGIASGARVLFCDEPTSGLSGSDAEQCVQYMRTICQRLHATIVVIIHQPRMEVAELFDHLVLLTRSPGRVVYNGPMSGAEAHFEQVVGKPMPDRINPMDYCMDLVTPDCRRSCQEVCVDYYDKHCRPSIAEHVERELCRERSTPLELLQLWRRNMEQYGALPPLRSSKYGVRFRRQLQLVFMRQLTLNIRDQQGIIADLAVSVLKAIVIGMAYMNIGKLNALDQMSFLFMVLMSCALEPMKAMPKVMADRLIMKMETSDALYSEWAYFFSFTVISWVQTLMTNGLYVTILFLMSGLPWSMFGDLFLWTTLLAFTMDSLFLMVAAVAKDTSAAFVISLPFLMLFLLYNGFTVTRTTVPSFLKWAVEVSPIAHTMEAVIIAASKAYSGGDSMYPDVISVRGYVDDPTAALEAILACIFFFRSIQVVALKKMNNIQR